MKLKITNKGLYWGLVATFGLLYLLVAFVSTLHAIDFFRLSNIGALAILLGVAYEVGQASVLFSILMTKNKEKFLPWLLMILLTALQVTANVYASFKHMSISGNNDWTYWYTSILKIFGVGGGTPETYQVIISWISGALLPIVALGMTALVAQNIKLITEEDEIEDGDEPVAASDVISEVSRVRPTDDDLEMAEEILSKKKPEGYSEKEIPLDHPIGHEPSTPKEQEEIEKIKKLMTMKPIESGAISDNLKKTLSPGLELEEDAGDSPREQISKIVNDGIHVEDETPEPDGKEVIPALSDEEIAEAWMVELEGKEPEHIPEILGNANGVYIDGRKLEHMDELEGKEPESIPEIEPTPTEDVAQIPPENEPESTSVEPQNEKSEHKKFIDNVFPVDIISNNGLVDIEPKDIGEVLTDLVERVKSSSPPVETEEERQERLRDETEEEKQERLREVAREKLKKK